MPKPTLKSDAFPDGNSSAGIDEETNHMQKKALWFDAGMSIILLIAGISLMAITTKLVGG